MLLASDLLNFIFQMQGAFNQLLNLVREVVAVTLDQKRRLFESVLQVCAAAQLALDVHFGPK